MLINFICEAFEIKKKIRLYNFLGFEMIDDSDVCNFKNRIIFFTIKNEIFKNLNFMRSLKLKKKIGEGGFGKVYLADQRITDEKFAVKIFRLNFFDVKDVNFLYKEIEFLRRLEHVNIIKLYTYCVLEDDRLALILEYASGGTLREYLQEKKTLDESEIRKIMKQIFEAVNYSHKKGIIHRDLKSENIMFTDKNKNKIKIIDFGVSGIFKMEKSKAGSVKYMAPEVLDESNTESLPSLDVWSLGCILYELLTGNNLFEGTKQEILEKIKRDKSVKLPPNISQDATDLLKIMLKININERICISDCLNHPWIINDKVEVKVIQEKDTEQLTQSNCVYVSSVPDEFPEFSMKKFNLKTNYNFNKNIIPRFKIKQMDTNELPSLMTKVYTETSDVNMYDYHFSLMRKFNGNIPNFLQPIGHNKNQKQKFTKIKTFMKKYYDISHPTQETQLNENKHKSISGKRLNTSVEKCFNSDFICLKTTNNLIKSNKESILNEKDELKITINKISNKIKLPSVTGLQTKKLSHRADNHKDFIKNFNNKNNFNNNNLDINNVNEDEIKIKRIIKTHLIIKNKLKE